MVNTDGFPYLIIDDTNAHLFSGNSPLNRSTGYQGWQPPERKHFFSGPRPVGKTIPRNQWHDRIKEGAGTFLSDLLKAGGRKAKDQRSLKYCWCYGSVRAYEMERDKQALPVLDLSPESVGGPATNWRNTGGWATEAFEQMEQTGVCEMSYMDAPNSLRHRLWQRGWEKNALLHRAVQWYELEDTDPAGIYEEVITCLLNRTAVAAGLGWWGHLVCFLDPVILPDGSVGVLFQNSWGVDWPTPGANGLACLTESRGTPDGAAAPVLTSST